MQVSTYNSNAHPAASLEPARSWPQRHPAHQLYELCETTTTVTKKITGPFPHLAGAPPFNTQQHQSQQQHRTYTTVPAQPEDAHVTYSQSLPTPRQRPANPTNNSSGPPAIKGFFVEGPQKQPKQDNLMAVFGGDYVTNVMEYFYIGEKPVVSQPDDGVIKIPAPTIKQFMDGFKVDVTGHGITELRILRDLPSRDVICCQRKKRTAISPTVMICTGSVADDQNLVAYVRRTGDQKAMIDLEKRGQTQYTAEGNLTDRTYVVKKNSTQVAQISRNDDARTAVTSKHSYCLQVAPGTDCVLMIAVAMAIEDIYRAK